MAASTTKPTLTPSAKTAAFSDERSKFLKQLEIPLLMFLLKKCSSRQHPLSAAEIAQYMISLSGEEHSDKTMRRKLKNLCSLQEDTEDELINNVLFLTFGGYIARTTNQSTPGVQKVQSHYYFVPLLDTSDVDLICGAITSNRYLSPEEKKYLLSRERSLTVYDTTDSLSKEIEKQAFFPTELPPKPTARTNAFASTSNLLHLVNQLHHAIENEYKIQLIYGIYDIDEHNIRKIHFHARNADKPYTINPYALLWNGGSYYLIGTHDGHNNPVHFRVDRILSIKPVPTPEDATKFENREPLPDTLKPFFLHNEQGEPTFHPEKYTAAYPLMGIYDEADTTDCYIECTAGTLSILIDTFGKDLTLAVSPLPHSEDELDFNGKKQHFFAARIKNVQYNNIVKLCLQQHSSITALHPHRLVEDVQKGLADSLHKYETALLLLDEEYPLRLKNK